MSAWRTVLVSAVLTSAVLAPVPARAETKGKTTQSGKPKPRAQTAPVKRVTPKAPSRVLGLGGRVGGYTLGIGGSVRYWGEGDLPLGFQFDLSRYGQNQSFAGGSYGYSITQFAPSVIYRIGETLGNENVEVEPYVGGGLNIYRTTLNQNIPGIGSAKASATNAGILALGGVQIFLKQVPKLGISGEAGYYQSGDPFTGISVGGFAVTAGAHWYVK